MRLNQFKRISFDGTIITSHLLTPDQTEAPESSILILHGASEHSGRYTEFMEHLCSTLHVPVCATDLRGFGRSGGKRGHWPDFRTAAADISMIVIELKRRFKRVHLIGHSLGGLLAAFSCSTILRNHIETLSLSSPCLKLSFEIPRATLAIAACVVKIRPDTTFKTPVNPDVLTHDSEIKDTYLRDELITHKMTAALFFSMISTQRQMSQLSDKIRIPTLIVQAGDDRVVDAGSSEHFAGLLKCEKEFHLLEGRLHEILQEKDRKNTYQIFSDFLAGHMVS